ncbi:acyltransferase [Andreprevotia chitinilytica]|uniref:acyltransferase n=1 Tax=Andreprevotia chitinilytica TaxID=396808 RepID=UPI001B7FF298|nr:acyltransferase [Andreprevotia chitinilytica]
MSVKDNVLQLLKRIWASDAFALSDNQRSKALREELLKRALTLVMTDDERAMFYGLPAGCRMRENAKIIASDKLSCGEFVWIGEGVILDASGGLTVGEHTTVGSGSYIWSHSSAMANVMMDNASGNPYIIRKETKIGNGVFIGGPSVIYPGVTVGNRCIILPMSVVTKDVPMNSMVGGSPARVIRDIDEVYLADFMQQNGIGGGHEK